MPSDFDEITKLQRLQQIILFLCGGMRAGGLCRIGKDKDSEDMVLKWLGLSWDEGEKENSLLYERPGFLALLNSIQFIFNSYNISCCGAFLFSSRP